MNRYQRLFFGVALSTAAFVACGGATDQGTLASTGSGGSAGSGGAGSGTGGSAGSAQGGVSQGGASQGGVSQGGVSQGGAIGAGGLGMLPCTTIDGAVVVLYKTCTEDSQCGVRTIEHCCGSDLVTGLRKDAQCSTPAPDCGALGCAHFADPTADDGKSATPPATIQSQCVAGSCTTHVVPGTATDCGGTTCNANELCIHPPTSVGGPAPQCVPALDGGLCPPGTERAFCVGGGASEGCVETYVPPPPYCAPIPATCGATIDCKCIPQSLCGGGADFCQSVEGHSVTCVNLAP